MTYVLSELQELQWSRPSVEASVVELAAWYERKAVVLEHLHAERAAVVAREHAARLLSPLGVAA